ncbi:MAG: DNA mismatch repair endonuclease MutL [Myxococcales bacterium]|nr:DNA mismatch repair endonuclease MutL [Myxococcota bacterium]MDW8281900.1 DNA mismatch repair endonuclease MutL [Myxococcales bacterium]
MWHRTRPRLAMPSQSRPRIAVLPPELANQIAAGEVVERPASVVKELCENSIDAGARRIEVEIDRGGLGLIRVTDDGCGMTEEEAQLSLLRHATSKLHRIEDLLSLHSLGFRGEALPSIAAVSRFRLVTRTALDEGAVCLEVEGGRPCGPPRPASAPVGTQVEVRDLFYNVPARLKFMKGQATEIAHAAEAVLRLALAYPEVHLRLRSGTREVLDLPPHPDRMERAQAALRTRLREHTTLYAAAGEQDGIRVEAQLGAPSEATATPRNVFLLVNGRFVRDRSLLHAVVTGYGEQLPEGRYPLCVLHVTLPPGEVDVNVHPQKLEVRFQRPHEVYAAVRHTIGRTALAAPWILPQGPARVYHLGAAARAGEPVPSPYGEPRSGHGAQVSAPQIHPGVEHQLSPVVMEPDRRCPQPMLRFQVLSSEQSEPAPPRRFFSAMNYLGQFQRTYLVCEHEHDLVLIDQHAAHERLLFERLRAARADGSAPLRSQRLLLPVQLELEPAQAALVQEETETLARLGFELVPFGGRSFVLQAVPDVAAFGRGARTYQDPANLLQRVLDELSEHGRSETVQARIERVLATVACHSVVRAGDVLDEPKARALLSAMDEVDFVPHCPHGRPVLVRLSLAEIERRFGRT